MAARDRQLDQQREMLRIAAAAGRAPLRVPDCAKSSSPLILKGVVTATPDSGDTGFVVDQVYLFGKNSPTIDPAQTFVIENAASATILVAQTIYALRLNSAAAVTVSGDPASADWQLLKVNAGDGTQLFRFELSANKTAGAATATGWILSPDDDRSGDPVTLIDPIASTDETLTAGFYGRGPYDGPPGSDQRGYFGVCALIAGQYIIVELEPPARFGTATHTYGAGSGTPSRVTTLAEQFMGREHPPESASYFQDPVTEADRIPVGSLAIFDELYTAGFKYVDGARMRRFNYKLFMNFSSATANVAMSDATGAAYDPEVAFTVKNTGNKFHAGAVGWTGYAAEVRGEWIIVASESYPHWIVATLATDLSGGAATATINSSWEGEKTPPSPVQVRDTINAFPGLTAGKKVLCRLKSVTSTEAIYEIVEAEGGQKQLRCELLIIDGGLRLRVWLGPPNFDDALSIDKCQSEVPLVNDCCIE